LNRIAKYHFILLLIITLPVVCYGQQRLHFTQYMVNPYVLNPAVGGVSGDLEMAVGYRKQWVNFNGGPLSFYFSGHLPIKLRKKPSIKTKSFPFHSVGTFIYKDVTGPISKTSALASYSYNIPVFKDFRLALGLFMGVLQLNLDQSKLKFDQDGEVLKFNNKTMPDASSGIWFYNPKYFFGVSVNQLFMNRLNFYNDFGYMVYHYYLTSGYKIPLGYEIDRNSNYNFYLIPSFMLKYGGTGTPPSLDLNVKIRYRDQFWTGGSYRVRDSFSFLAGVLFHSKNNGIFEVGYSYDYTISKINHYTSGSHEIIVKYNYRLKRQIPCPDNFW